MVTDIRKQNGKVAAIITAAGKGTRMKSDINKQYMDLGGIPVLARTIFPFQDSPRVDEIIVVINEEDIKYCKTNIIEKYGLSKVTSLVSGGAERQNSVYKGLCAVDNLFEIVMIHDGARPFITVDKIEECIDNARIYGACGLGVKVKDTIKISDSEGFVSTTPDRNCLWSIQTPQCFNLKLIMNAHDQAIKNGYVGTDDMVLVEKMGIPVKILEGSYINIKITTPEDIAIGESILRSM